MKFTAKTFLLSAAGYFLLLCTLYYACFIYSCGRYINAEWWIKDIYEYKFVLNSLIESPRIIIAGGSNSLFGMNSDIVNKITGHNVINIASHAGLDISFHYYKIKEYMRDGDIVVIPLEFYYYYNDDPYTEWFINNMIAWGKEDYIDRLNIIDLAKFIFHVKITSIVRLIFNEKEPPLNKKPVILFTVLKSSGHRWNDYSFKSLDRNGEINIDAEPDASVRKLKDKGIPYTRDLAISDHFVNYYKKIEKIVKQRNGKLILAWPVSIRNHLFDLADKDHQDSVFQLAEKLKKESIVVSCDPAMFNMDIQYFFNTEYHLNKKGGQIRSERLARCINDVLHQ